MTRMMLATSVLLLAVAGQAPAQDKEAECRKIGQIATDIVTERTSGADMRAAERRVVAAIPDKSENDEVLAVQLVSWIYTLPEDQLGPVVANTLYEACLAQ